MSELFARLDLGLITVPVTGTGPSDVTVNDQAYSDWTINGQQYRIAVNVNQTGFGQHLPGQVPPPPLPGQGLLSYISSSATALDGTVITSLGAWYNYWLPSLSASVIPADRVIRSGYA